MNIVLLPFTASIVKAPIQAVGQGSCTAGVTLRRLFEDKVDMEGMEWAMHNLGVLFSGQGQLAEAEKMYIRALQGGGTWTEAYIDTADGQQPRHPLRRPMQAGRSRGHVHSGAARL